MGRQMILKLMVARIPEFHLPLISHPSVSLQNILKLSYCIFKDLISYP